MPTLPDAAHSSNNKSTPRPNAPINQTPRVRRIRKAWLFRALAIVFPLGIVGLAEFYLRLTNVGIDPTLVLLSSRDPTGSIHYFNPRVDVAYCSIDLRGPEPRAFALPTPPGTFRVVVVGASTVQGYPYPSELSFPRHLELVLQKQVRDQKVEVLNAGIIGLSTTPLVDLVNQCIKAQPDLVVLYAGHNEFYGVGGLATNANITPAGIMFRQQRLGQLLSSYAHGEVTDISASADLIENFPAEYRIPNGSELIRQARETYRRNVSEIANICIRHNIPIVLCGVASNLRHQSPLTIGDEAKLLADTETQVQLVGDENRLQQVRNIWDEACSRHPDAACLHFRRAQCLELQGEHDAATDEYILARDLDPCRYRAPGSFNTILAEIAAESDSNCVFLDLAGTCAANSKPGSPGENLFLEHVHFNIEGHWLAAREIARTITSDIRHQAWNEDLVPSIKERNNWLGLVPEDSITALSLAFFIMQSTPFNEAIDANVRSKVLVEKVAELSNQLSAKELQVFQSVSHGEQMDDLIDGLGRIWLNAEEIEQANNMFKRSIRRRPWMPNGYIFAGICEYLLGNTSAALEHVKESEQTNLPESNRLIKDKNRLLRNLNASQAN